MTPEMSKMIDDEVEKRLKQRLKQDEPEGVRKRLNFKSEEDDLKEIERQKKESYDQRLEMLIQADERKKADRDEKEQKKMEEMFKMFLELKSKDE